MSNIALFDLDNTLADYQGQLLTDLSKIRSLFEPEVTLEQIHIQSQFTYIESRRHMITNQNGWWLNLPKFKLGFDILEECNKLGYEVNILTKGPNTKTHAWTEKLEWCQKNITNYDGITITSNKSLVYGKVLVDDWPEYILPWLKYRPRGLVIMPAHHFNKDFKHKNVIRYDGSNLDEVKEALSLRL